MQDLDGPGGLLGEDAAHGHGQGPIPVHQDQRHGAGKIGRIFHNFADVIITRARQVVVGEGLRRPDVHQFKGVG